VLVFAIHQTWPDTLVSLAVETLRRIDAVKRAERAEQLNLVLKRNATLGQYVIDMRHSLNNALTSVLGNAELLLLEPGAFSAAVRSQLDTIRHMSLRMHEVLQRFSSLEKELSFAERQGRNEGGLRQVAAAAQPGL
jgi:signal transduction histidine kinase